MFSRILALAIGALFVAAPQLIRAASIAGTLSSAATNLPIEYTTVYLMNAASKTVIGATSTASDGSYLLGNLTPGDYGVCVLDPSDDYVDGCYDGVSVGADGVLNFTTITLSNGQDLQGVNVTLQIGTTLSGTLLDNYLNTPIANVWANVTLYSSQQNEISNGGVYTDANGDFMLHGLAAGSYYLEAGVAFVSVPNSAYPPRLYGGGSCIPQCPFATGTLINVPPSGASDISFPLSPGYFISGTVTDAQTGLGIPNVTINTCDNPSFFLSTVSASTITDANGHYLISHAANEQTRIATVDASGYVNLTWPNAVMPPAYSCRNSAIYGGDVLAFSTPDTVLSGVDFALQPGAAVSGTVTTNNLLGNEAKVAIYSDDGQSTQLIGIVNTAADGTYTTVGVGPGTYHVAAYYDNGEDCQIYDHFDCGTDWSAQLASGINTFGSTPITLTNTQHQSGVNLELLTRIFAGNFE